MLILIVLEIPIKLKEQDMAVSWGGGVGGVVVCVCLCVCLFLQLPGWRERGQAGEICVCLHLIVTCFWLDFKPRLTPWIQKFDHEHVS